MGNEKTRWSIRTTSVTSWCDWCGLNIKEDERILCGYNSHYGEDIIIHIKCLLNLTRRARFNYVKGITDEIEVKI